MDLLAFMKSNNDCDDYCKAACNPDSGEDTSGGFTRAFDGNAAAHDGGASGFGS